VISPGEPLNRQAADFGWVMNWHAARETGVALLGPAPRELIAETALRLTDESGLSGLSMRKLGAELGVEAMSLYHYVANKDDLLDAMLDRLYAEIELPVEAPETDWETAVREGFRSFYSVLARHPAAVELFSSRPARSVSSIEVLNWAYKRFLVLGLEPARAFAAFRFGVSFVMGHAASEFGVMNQLQEVEGVDPATLSDPELQEFVRRSADITPEDLFESGLDAVVAGLRSLYELP